jgi:hypothetical protein
VKRDLLTLYGERISIETPQGGDLWTLRSGMHEARLDDFDLLRLRDLLSQAWEEVNGETLPEAPKGGS